MGENKRQPACARETGVTRNGKLAFSTLKLCALSVSLLSIHLPAFLSPARLHSGPLSISSANRSSKILPPERVQRGETHQACRTILSRLASHTACSRGKSHHAGRNRRTGGEAQFLSCFHRCQFVAGADESIATQDSPFFSSSYPCSRQPRGR